MKLTTAFGVGAAIGVGLVIMFVPRVRREIRETLEQVSASVERGQTKVHEIVVQAIRVADQAKDQAQRVQDAIDAGVRAVKEMKNLTSSGSS